MQEQQSLIKIFKISSSSGSHTLTFHHTQQRAKYLNLPHSSYINIKFIYEFSPQCHANIKFMEPSDRIHTPKLDAESPQLLQRVTEQGGYAFSNMAAFAARGDLIAAEAALEMAWEQLHFGPSSSVLPVWRDAYSMACLHVAKAQYSRGEFKEAIRVVDNGLAMGGALLWSDLVSAARKLSAKTTMTSGGGKVVVDRGGDDNGKEEEDESQKSECGENVNETEEPR